MHELKAYYESVLQFSDSSRKTQKESVYLMMQAFLGQENFTPKNPADTVIVVSGTLMLGHEVTPARFVGVEYILEITV